MNLPGGGKVAWLDRRTGELNLLVEEYRGQVLDVLAPYLPPSTGPDFDPDPAPVREPAPAPVQVPAPARDPEPVLPGTPLPENDLAGNRPGTPWVKVNELAPGFWRWALARLFVRKLEVDSWRTGVTGEQRVGAELERLAGRGWRVLHSIPLPGEVDIDHLLIGPGGVFCFNTKHHRGARIWVGDDSVRVGGWSYPYVRKSRAEARRAAARDRRTWANA
ncbi:NERD domain-containing protein [Streptomyces sp. NPDC004726]